LNYDDPYLIKIVNELNQLKKTMKIPIKLDLTTKTQQKEFMKELRTATL